RYVTGLWTSTIGTAEYDATGSHYICDKYKRATQCVEPLPDFPTGALIGYDGNEFLRIGNNLTFYAKESDKLWLRMNDGGCCLSDNEGSIIVQITIF
ncbi:MAG TPA: hypothetical protein VH590_07870, partial [Ktedonobacterales bacterium]